MLAGRVRWQSESKSDHQREAWELPCPALRPTGGVADLLDLGGRQGAVEEDRFVEQTLEVVQVVLAAAEQIQQQDALEGWAAILRNQGESGFSWMVPRFTGESVNSSSASDTIISIFTEPMGLIPNAGKTVPPPADLTGAGGSIGVTDNSYVPGGTS